MNGKNNEQEQDTAIARLYRAGNDTEPAAHLDEAILAASRREAGAKPRPVSPFGGQRLMTLSTAAVILIAFGLVTFVAEREPAMLNETAALEDKKPADPAEAKQKQLAREIIGGKAEELAQRRQREIQPQAHAPAPVTDQEISSEQPAADRADDAGAASFGMAKSATAPDPARQEAGRLQGQADTPADRSRDAASATVVAEGTADVLQDNSTATPQDWLRSIDKLIAEDRLDAARRELRTLQEKFPDFTLEKKYRDLLADK
jgi:hypothetical protein